MSEYAQAAKVVNLNSVEVFLVCGSFWQNSQKNDLLVLFQDDFEHLYQPTKAQCLSSLIMAKAQ